jgi:hypothetical protein
MSEPQPGLAADIVAINVGVGEGSSTPTTGVGETLKADLLDPKRKRGTYAILQRAIDITLDIPMEAMRFACMTAVQDLKSPDDRIRSRAREFLFKVQDSGIGAAVSLDRMGRLDEGQATDRIELKPIVLEARD